MAAMPLGFESSFPHQLWGCCSVDRALRSPRRGRGVESPQPHPDFNRPFGRFFIALFFSVSLYFLRINSGGKYEFWDTIQHVYNRIYRNGDFVRSVCDVF